MRIDKETAEALGLKRVIWETVRQALFLVITLGFIGWWCAPYRDAMTSFSTNFPTLVAEIKEMKEAINSLVRKEAGQVAQLKR